MVFADFGLVAAVFGTTDGYWDQIHAGINADEFITLVDTPESTLQYYRGGTVARFEVRSLPFLNAVDQDECISSC